MCLCHTRRDTERLSVMLTTKPTQTVREERNDSKSTGQMMGGSALNHQHHLLFHDGISHRPRVRLMNAQHLAGENGSVPPDSQFDDAPKQRPD